MEKTSPFITRPANKEDISFMVTLSDQKRRLYENEFPQFWKNAENANELQEQWFTSLLGIPNYFIYVADGQTGIIGFIIGQNITAPEIYNPGGLTLMIDDFCVESPELWGNVGNKLLADVTEVGKVSGAAQILVVSDFHDQEKRLFLQKNGLCVASEWYVKRL